MMAMPDRRLRADRLAINRTVVHAKPRKRMSYRVKEYLIWAGLIFVAIVAVVVFGGNV